MFWKCSSGFYAVCTFCAPSGHAFIFMISFSFSWDIHVFLSLGDLHLAWSILQLSYSTFIVIFSDVFRILFTSVDHLKIYFHLSHSGGQCFIVRLQSQNWKCLWKALHHLATSFHPFKLLCCLHVFTIMAMLLLFYIIKLALPGSASFFNIAQLFCIELKV